MMPLTAMSVAFLLPLAALAHDDAEWINRGDYKNKITGEHCCGPKDCAILPSGQAFPAHLGWFLPATNETIGYSLIHRSKDGQFWRCSDKWGRTRCLFVPLEGS
jgi:hypothetical protein